MRTYNRATIIGRVGNEVVLRTTRTGKNVVNLSIATNERRRDGIETTTWHRAVLWEHLADYAGRFLQKGDPVYLEGRLGSADWTDKEGGQHTRTEITATELIGLAGRGARGADGAVDVDGADVAPPEAARASRRPRGQRPDGEETEEVGEEIPF